MIREFFTGNYAMFYEWVGLLVMLGVSVHISPKMKRQTRIVVALLFAETLFFYLERWTQTFETLHVLRPLLTAAVYSIYPVIMLLVMQITSTGRFSGKRWWILLIPEFVCVPLFFTSQWTHLVAYFTADNNYHGGPLSYLPYILFGFYAVCFIVHNTLYFRHYARRDRLIAAYIVVGPLTGVLLYLLWGVDRDYSALFTSAIVLYFIYIYIHTARIDTLTTLLNRQSYYRDMQAQKAVTGVVSADMNDLKVLNDTKGHAAGDAALCTVAAVMRDHCGRGGTVYRVGGDEFMILYVNTKEADLASAVATMRREMAKTPYVCAFGYAMRRSGETVVDAIRKSDALMYEDKAALKREKANQSQP